MNGPWIILVLLVLVVALLWVLIAAAGRLALRISETLLRRRVRRELAHESASQILTRIDGQISHLQDKVKHTKANAARLAGRGGVIPHLEGPYSQLRWLRRYRATLLELSQTQP